MNSITIGSGYFSKYSRVQKWFYNLWRQQIAKVFGTRVNRCFVVCSGNCRPGSMYDEESLIHLAGNLGSGDHASARGHAFCGWAGAMLSTALLAYSNETDYVWCEQDVLVFGDTLLEQMYKDMGERNAVFGQRPIPDEACTSLFLVRWSFLPEFVTQYLLEGHETSAQRTPERKFYRMRHRCPEDYSTLSFGVDRERPIPESLPLYVHKLSPDDFKVLGERKLVDLTDMPQCFIRASNHLEPGIDGPKWAE